MAAKIISVDGGGRPTDSPGRGGSGRGRRRKAVAAVAALLVVLAVLVPTGTGAQSVSDDSDASLSALSLSGADLGFDPAETQYWVAYGAAVEYPTVSAVAAQAGAQVSISPTDVDIDAPGHQAEVLAFWPVRVTVTSPDGTATRTYSLWMFDFRLQSLGVEGHDIGFDPLVTDYALEVPSGTKQVTVTADASSHTFTHSHPDADPDTDGHQVGLDAGDNTITVTATPRSRIILAPQTYTITITRPPLALEANQNNEQEEEEEEEVVVILDNDPPVTNDDASLSSLELTGATLGFDAATLSYDVDFVAAADQATITAEANNAGATISFSPTDADDNAEGHQIAITSSGTTTATVTVTASDTTTTQTYQLNITDTRLRGLDIDGYDIGFDPATASYTLSVPNSVEQVTVGTGTETNTKLDISYSPATDADDNAEGHQVDLDVGANTITATATLTGGTDTQTYTITITRDADASLSSLTIDPGFLRFDPYRSSHTAYVLPSTESVTVTAEANDAGATVEITPGDADDNAGGHQIATTDDTVTVTVTVTASDDTTTTTHTVTVKHRPGGFVKIDVGTGTACALHLSGQVLCWGQRREGFYYPPHTGRAAVSPPASEKYVDVEVGLNASCGIRTDGTVHCWELDTSWTSVTDGTAWSLAHDQSPICHLDTDRLIGCGGHSGLDDRDDDVPAEMRDKQYRDLAVSRRVVCAVDFDNQVDCFGDSFYPNLDVDGKSPEGDFTAVSGSGGAWQHFCGIKTDGSVQCWEYKNSRRSTWRNREVLYMESSARTGPYIDVSVSQVRTCGIKSDNTSDCWRWSRLNSLLWGGRLPSGFAYEAISVGYRYFFCGLTTDGYIKCAGSTVGGRDYPVVDDSSVREVRLSGLNLDFDSDSTTHSVGPAHEKNSTTITVTPRHAGTTVEIVPADADDSAGGHQIELTGDSVTVTVTATSFDGSSETVHTIEIDRTAPPDEDRLRSLNISDVELDFDDDTYLYRADVEADVASVTVTPTAYDPDATVVVLPVDADTNNEGHQISLTAGAANFVNINVLSEDTTEVAIYTIVINRPDS